MMVLRDGRQRLQVTKKSKKNPKAFYKFVNSKLKTSYRVNDIMFGDNTPVSSDTGKAAEVFNTYFSSIFTKEESINEMPDFCVRVKETLGNTEFTEFDVLKLPQNVNSSNRQARIICIVDF